MKYKLIIFDIGKTLLDKHVSNEISKRTLDDIKALQNKGIKVGVCTMWTLTHCRKLIPFELDFYICLNGSHITCDGITIFDSPIELKPASSEYLTYGTDYAFYSCEIAKEKAIANGFLVDKAGMAKRVYNLVLFDVTKDQLPDHCFFNTEYWENTKTLVLQNSDSSKSLGIQKVLDYYKCQEPILYFGDGPNDLPVFERFQDCVCMGDCYPRLLEHSIFQTKPCKDDGVSYALRMLEVL